MILKEDFESEKELNREPVLENPSDVMNEGSSHKGFEKLNSEPTKALGDICEAKGR